MNAKQENKLGSYKRIVSLLDANNALLAVLATLFNIYQSFKAKVTEIVLCVQHQEDSIKGYTEAKSLKRTELSEMAYIMANALRSYFSKTGDREMYGRVEICRSDLDRARDEDLVPVCRNIHEMAVLNIGNLGGYGVDAIQVATFLNLIESYNQYSQRPYEVRSRRHEYTAELERLYREADVLLEEQLDSGMTVFMKTQPKLYAEYLEARRIFDTGSHKRKIAMEDNAGYLLVKVLNGADNSEIAGALVKIESLGLTEESDEDSEAYFEKVPSGVHKIVVTCEGFKTYEGSISIEAGDEMNLEVLLEAEIYDPDPDVNTEDSNE